MNNTTDNLTTVLNAFPIGGKKFANVPVKEMRIDSSYQRVDQLNKKTLKELKEHWDSNQCNTLLVSYRDDVFYVVDGMHRKLGAEHNEITHLPCEIKEGLTSKDEAKIFAYQDKNKKKLTPYDIHRANLSWGEDTSISLQELCEKYNVLITQTTSKSKPNRLGSISECRRIINANGADTLEWIFNIIKNSGFHSQKNGYRTEIISAIEKIYLSHLNLLDKTSKQLVTILSKLTPEELLARASNRYSGGYRNTIKLYLEDAIA